MREQPALVLAVHAAPGHAWAAGSPEGPHRVAHCLAGLREAGLLLAGREESGTHASVRLLPGPHTPAPRALLTSIHPPAYLGALAALHTPTKVADEDDAEEFTYAGPGSLAEAAAAAGCVTAVVDAVCGPPPPGGSPRPAGLALVRPPGHHAGPGSGPDLAASALGLGGGPGPGRAPSGFCLLSNVALGAAHARDAWGRGRPLVVDLDVHVGDGTQAALAGWGRGEGGGTGGGALVIDLHEAGVWPFDRGDPADGGPPAGPAIINVPLPPGSGDAAARAALARVITPAAVAFRPDIVFVCLGLDAHAADPLGRLAWRSRTYGALLAGLARLASDLAGGRLVVVLEGGYSAAGLARGTAAVGRALVGRQGVERARTPADEAADEGGTDVDEEAVGDAEAAVRAALDDVCTRHGL